MPDLPSRSAEDDEEIEVTYNNTSKKYFVAKIKEEEEEKGLNPVSQTQPSTSATGRPTQEKCVTSSREESTRRTPPKDRLGKRPASAGQASPHSSKREQRRSSRRSRDRRFQRQHHGQTDPRVAWATYEGRATKKGRRRERSLPGP